MQGSTITQTIGMLGAILAGIAYLPQIIHLIKEKCSAGISRNAYTIWLIASTSILIHAFAIKSFVFIILAIIQLTSTALVLFFSIKYKGTCDFHTPNDTKK